METFLSHIKFKKDRVIVTVLLLISILLYLPSLKHGFVWDDWSIIFREIKNLKGLSIYSPHDIYYRPVTTLTFILDHIIWNDNPIGYHLTNIILHLTNVYLLFLLVNNLIQLQTNNHERSKVIAFFSAITFSVYPIHVESVSWIAGRTDLVVSLFVLLSFFSYHLYRATGNWKGLIPTFIFSLLAIGSKETGVIILPMILLWEVLLAPRMYGKRDTKAIITVLVIGLAVSVYIAIRLPGIEHYTGGNKAFPLITLVKALGFYVRYLLVPYPVLNYIPSIPVSNLYSVLGLGWLSLTILSPLFTRTTPWWTRGAAFSMLLTSLSILPSLGLIILSIGATPIALRYLYLPSIFFCMLIAFVLIPLTDKLGFIRTFAAVFTIFLIFTPITLKAEQIWKNELSFWKEAIRLAPDKAIPLNQYGIALARTGRIKEAIHEFYKALAAPDIQKYPWEKSKIYLNLSKSFLQLGYLNKALKAADTAMNLNPDFKASFCIKTDINLALFKKTGNKTFLIDALDCVNKCLSYQLSPRYLFLATNISLLLGERDKSLFFLKKLLTTFPDSKEAKAILKNTKRHKSR